MFLKGKNTNGENILVAASAITTVRASGTGTFVELKNGASVTLDLGFQSVINRLNTLGAEIA